jgi:hypothetical protein
LSGVIGSSLTERIARANSMGSRLVGHRTMRQRAHLCAAPLYDRREAAHQPSSSARSLDFLIRPSRSTTQEPNGRLCFLLVFVS